MIGHCEVVSFQRRSVSSGGSSTTPARPRSILSSPSSTKIRDQTISPGLETPLSVPPPRRKYISGWRSLEAPCQAPTKWAGGAEPLIRNTHT